jgi:hypothetical protein
MPIKAGRPVVRKAVIDHDLAKSLINDAFNAWTLRAIDARWSAFNLSVLAEQRRQVMEYLEHLKRTAEGREIRR